MKKIKIENVCLHDQFDGHSDIKENLISLLLKANAEELEEKEHRHKIELPYNIKRSDWQTSTDEDREWVNYFTPYLRKNFDRMLDEIGFDTNYVIKNLWFQHYIKSNIHNWHTHSDNYTGVYYLKFDGQAKTQLLNTYNNELINIDSKEGDLIIFPSSIVHRCPRVHTEKIIISFNFEVASFTKKFKKFMKDSFTND